LVFFLQEASGLWYGVVLYHHPALMPDNLASAAFLI